MLHSELILLTLISKSKFSFGVPLFPIKLVGRICALKEKFDADYSSDIKG